ncbi:hypothetical protein POPTR_016G138232v4 [Populus trichocarpa]|uniref:Uncharacterized protein n=1 Tax=Populus trichocarpa TaxID=3694 RepID=A0ACC0RUP6_POPTR|nr:hypothetical protein POPTR_016G138232v4 [Populus trichocarpa]
MNEGIFPDKLLHKSRDSSDFSRPMLGGIIPVYWLCDKFSPIKPGRLVTLSGISPLKLLHERSECSLLAKIVRSNINR